jgi:hypothetical protein
MSHPEPLLDLLMQNALALIELGQPCVNLREEDHTLYRVIHGRVGRQVLQGLKDAIALRWRSQSAHFTADERTGNVGPTCTPTASDGILSPAHSPRSN